MTLFAQIDAWIIDAEGNIPQQRRKKKVRLYGEGVKSKLKQAEYSLAQLALYSNQSDDTTTTTDPDETSITDRVGFYCDAYWAFLFSSLDILAQVINQSLNLGLDEKDVSFKKIEQKLHSPRHMGTRLQQEVSTCLNSFAFRNLDRYRNCSTHRRQIFIREQSLRLTTTETPGYKTTSTGPVTSIRRVICENPLEVNPKIGQQRQIPQYMIENQTKILEFVSDIFNNLTPIK